MTPDRISAIQDSGLLRGKITRISDIALTFELDASWKMDMVHQNKEEVAGSRKKASCQEENKRNFNDPSRGIP